ncbi:MAG: hypothetical protein IJZ38_03145 [Bacteroides sp.]|nr:hypothetical protein [Bacteroides sp.]
MIIKALMDLIYNLFVLLTSPISIPGLPDEVSGFISYALEYIRLGIGLLANWTDIGYLLVLFGIVVAVDVGVLLYKLVMWVIAKIPMIGIE